MPTLEPEWMAVTPCHRQLEKRIHGMSDGTASELRGNPLETARDIISSEFFTRDRPVDMSCPAGCRMVSWFRPTPASSPTA